MITFKLKTTDMQTRNIHPIKVKLILAIALMCIAMQLNAQSNSFKNLAQYLYSDFTKSVIKMKSGESHTAMMNYNTLTGKMIFNNNGDLTELNKPEVVDTIFINNARFVFQGGEFYEVLVNAPISLFIQHKSKIDSPGKPAAYGISSETAASTSVSRIYDDKTYNFKLSDDYKVTTASVNWVRMNNVMYDFTSERQFLKIFSPKKDGIKKFIAQSDINFKNRDDLIKLVIYCNELYR
jgi:hypothetical protein